jgi:hypothetical protein
MHDVDAFVDQLIDYTALKHETNLGTDPNTNTNNDEGCFELLANMGRKTVIML